MSTQKQIAANQQNCLKSTGPKSAKGKTRSRLNALKIGIFARSVLLPGEDPKHLAQLTRDLIVQYAPEGPCEKNLVDEIAAVTWRLLRCSKVESGLFHLYRRVDGKMGNEAQAFANDLKNLSTLTKLPLVEGALERKQERLVKRLMIMQTARTGNRVFE